MDRKNVKCPKLENIRELVVQAVAMDSVVLTSKRCMEKKHKTKITDQELIGALRNAKRWPELDKRKEEYNGWSYAFVGSTLDDRKLVVAIAVDKCDDLVVTTFWEERKWLTL